LVGVKALLPYLRAQLGFAKRNSSGVTSTVSTRENNDGLVFMVKSALRLGS